MLCQCDFSGNRKYMKGKHHFEVKIELSETLPRPLILSSLLSLHGQFHPHISLLIFSMVVTNSAHPEFRVQPLPGEKRACAKMHLKKKEVNPCRHTNNINRCFLLFLFFLLYNFRLIIFVCWLD